MLNRVWLLMIVTSFITACFTGKLPEVVLSITDSAKFAVTLAVSLVGIMSLWLGLMKIAEAAGLIDVFSRLLYPVLRRLFPDIPADSPALGAISVNFAANLLGLSNAATPFGLRAMEELKKINPYPGIASNTMCTFIALHSSNMQLVPTTAIALLAASGAIHPTDIVVPLLLTSCCSIFIVFFITRLMAGLPRYRIAIPLPEKEEALS